MTDLKKSFFITAIHEGVRCVVGKPKAMQNLNVDRMVPEERCRAEDQFLFSSELEARNFALVTKLRHSDVHPSEADV